MRFGIECIRDDKKAEELCLLACEDGNEFALGMKYLIGWQTEIDHKKAFRIFEKLYQKEGKEDQIKEEKGHSLFFLGRCYNNGHGTERNIKSNRILQKRNSIGGREVNFFFILFMKIHPQLHLLPF
jgi:hypothetical protein